MKIILTSALVISGLIGSVHAEPVAMQSSLHDSFHGSQVMMPVAKDSDLSSSLLGVKSFTLNTEAKAPVLARSNSFEHDKKAEAFTQKPVETKMAAKTGWFHSIKQTVSNGVSKIVQLVVSGFKAVFC